MAKMRASEDTDYDVILGKLICDRIGLDPARVLRDGLNIEEAGTGAACIKAETFTIISRADMEELRTIAHQRYMQGGPVG